MVWWKSRTIFFSEKYSSRAIAAYWSNCVPAIPAFIAIPKAFSDAVDVSGSMKQTDSERVAFETIELLVRLCGSNDRFGVVAFNDTVVYNSGLVSMADEKAKKELLVSLEQIPYAGETDNGLGMREAVSLLTGDGAEDTGKMLIYLADGVTDLERSSTGRTLEESAQEQNSTG